MPEDQALSEGGSRSLGGEGLEEQRRSSDSLLACSNGRPPKTTERPLPNYRRGLIGCPALEYGEARQH